MPPLRSAEPDLLTLADSQSSPRAPDQPTAPTAETDRQFAQLAANRLELSARLAARQEAAPDDDVLDTNWPHWMQPKATAILQPPRPQMSISARALEHASEGQVNREATG